MSKKYFLMSLSVVVLWIVMISIFFYIAISAKQSHEEAFVSQVQINYQEIVNTCGCHAEHDYKVGELDADYFVEYIKTVWIKFYLVTVIFTLLSIVLLLFIKSLSTKEKESILLTKALQGKIEIQNTKLMMAVEGAGLGYWHWNIQTGYHDVDERWLSILGLSEADIKHDESDWNSRIYPDDKEKVDSSIEKAIKNKKSCSVEFRMRHKDGHYVWIQGSGAVVLYDKSGNPLELSGVHQDISKRKSFELVHRQNELFLKSLYEKNPNIILVTDSKKMLQANDSFFKFFDEYSSLDQFLLEHNCICNLFEASEFNDTITAGEGEWVDEIFASSEPTVKITRRGKEHYFALYAKKILEKEHQNLIVTFSDITETYNMRHKFEELSIKDPLTGVYNRRYFNSTFVHEFNRAKRTKETFSFAILDIDNFKLYNDTYGHDQGDEALISLATSIDTLIQRSNEFFFRLGGEEFGVIFSAYSEEESLAYVQKLCDKIYDLQILHEKNEPYGFLTISIGLCFVKENDTILTNQIYKEADKALYKAKDSGKNRVIMVKF